MDLIKVHFTLSRDLLNHIQGQNRAFPPRKISNSRLLSRGLKGHSKHRLFSLQRRKKVSKCKVSLARGLLSWTEKAGAEGAGARPPLHKQQRVRASFRNFSAGVGVGRQSFESMAELSLFCFSAIFTTEALTKKLLASLGISSRQQGADE